MDTNPTPQIPILAAAWKRYAELDAASLARSRGHITLRRWVATLGVLATLFAILTQIYPSEWPMILALALKLVLILTPILVSVLAAFVNKYYSSSDWLALRAGAEDIQREIYLYRTVLQKTPGRRTRLEKRLAEIQRQMFRNLSGEMALKPFKGQVPPYYRPGDASSDPGFQDLTGEDYYHFRLESQLAWHVKKVNQFEQQRKRLQWGILLAGGSGAFLAAWGGPWTLWVAFTAAIVSALTGWNELRNLDSAVKNYSKVILELNILLDHWINLESEERTQSEFYMMVRSTEEVLWSQNIEYIKSMMEALASAREEDADLVEQVIREAKETDARFKAGLRDQMVSYTSEQLQTTEQMIAEKFETTLGTLAEEAGSEKVQQEMEAIHEAVSEAASAFGIGVSQLAEHLKSVSAEFTHIEFTKETPKEILNAKLSKYPLSGELKG